MLIKSLCSKVKHAGFIIEQHFVYTEKMGVEMDCSSVYSTIIFLVNHSGMPVMRPIYQDAKENGVLHFTSSSKSTYNSLR